MSAKLIRPGVLFDVECYCNAFLICFKSLDNKKQVHYQMYGKDSKLSTEQLQKLSGIFRTKTCIGFNNLNYDIPMVLGALSGYTCTQLFELSKSIIDSNQQG
jgi:hypothetical protein